MAVRFGADRLAADPSLAGAVRRVALATNDAARSAHDAETCTRSLLLRAGIPLVRLFSPEHGLGADATDGGAVGDSTDPLTGLPVISLYGARFAPSRAEMADTDIVLFDIPDVGARFYTYTWTLTHLIDACADAGIPLCVLDRPNPLGADLQAVEGPMLEPGYYSFVGRHCIPIRHSLTLGEVARLWRNERRPDADVRVIACEGWRRDALWPDTRLPFVPTSPALRTFEAALLYPGLCAFEATNLSVARGTPLSFQAVGAPWLDVERVRARFAARELPGIATGAADFTPATGPHAGMPCNGVRLGIADARAVRPVAAALALLAEVIASHPDDFGWAMYATAANPGGADHLERIVGSSSACALLRADPHALNSEALAGLTAAAGWQERWEAVRLYD